MTEAGHGAQVVKVLEDHTYELDEGELESVLLQDGVKDLPVVVVSVAGTFRRGKSFLLNFFLRYLTSSPSAREDGSWLGDDSQTLKGFSWRGGRKRNTTGILLWSEPFILTLPKGEKLAVLLMDTQGTFDSESTVRDCSTIFALSTLLSSVQIYNLSGNIQEDDLQHLQLFTEYGRMVRDKEGSKAFQVLEFLVRDWPNPDEFDYGTTGGEQFLQEILTIKPKMPQEMKDLRAHITSCFEKVSCFLMPHPGLKVTRNTFKGKLSEIDPDFKLYVKKLVASLFGSEKLMPKQINGEPVRARDLCAYFKTYMTLFNSDEVPSTTTIMEATVRAGMLAAVSEARAVYERGMAAECGAARPSLPADDLLALHETYLARARAAFTTKKKMGTITEAMPYLEELEKDLQNELPLYQQSNVAKTQDAVIRGNKAYDAVISGVTHGSPLCLHPADLVQAAQQACDAARAVFDASRRQISNKEDVERELFLKSLDMRYPELRKQNEQNHNTITMSLRMQYSEHMQAQCDVDPPLSEAELRRAHDDALKEALREFDAKRNLPSQYTEDVLKYNLTEEVTKTFVNTKKLNSSKNKAAMSSALAAYNEHMAHAWDSSEVFLHPQDFESEHSTGKCNALLVFRPRKADGCTAGFDRGDSDEQTLLDMISQRYRELKKVNDSANEAAVWEAYRYYYHRMEDLCRPIEHSCSTERKSIDEKNNFHNNTKNEAVNRFLKKQRNREFYSSGVYKENLIEKMNKEFNDHMEKL